MSVAVLKSPAFALLDLTTEVRRPVKCQKNNTVKFDFQQRETLITKGNACV